MWRLATARGADAVLLLAIAQRAVELAEERDERLARRIINQLGKALKK